MPFTITYNADLEIVETIFSGCVSAEEAGRELLESHQLAVDNNCRLFFADLSTAELQLALLDIYEALLHE